MTDVIEVQVPAPVQVIEVTVPGAIRTVEVQVPGLRGQPGPAADTSALIPRAGLAAAKDSAEFLALQSDAEVAAIYLQNHVEYDVGAALPTKRVYGGGKITINGVTLSGHEISFDPAGTTMVSAPSIYQEIADSLDIGAEVVVRDKWNIVLAPGSGQSRVPNKYWFRSTFVGVGVGRYLQECERSEVFGQGALGKARFADRCISIGTLAHQWLGQDLSTDPAGRFYEHNVYNGDGTPLLLGDGSINSAWDKAGLKTDRPACTTELKAWYDGNNWAVGKSQVSSNVAVGRDSSIQLLKGILNTTLGYRSGGLMVEASQNTWIGAHSGYKALWTSKCVGLGAYAGYKHQTGDSCVYLGTESGWSHTEGSNCLMIGTRAGYSTGGTFTGNRSVLIGSDAGRKSDGTTDSTISNKFYLQAWTGWSPLLSGEFDNGRLGINLPVGTAPLGRLHSFGGASGAALSASGNSLLVLENNTDAFARVIIPNTNAFWHYVGDPEGLAQGGWGYDHAQDYLALKATTKFAYLSKDGDFFTARVPALASPATAEGGVGNALRATGGMDVYKSGTGNVPLLRFYNSADSTAAIIGQIAANGSSLSLRSAAGTQQFRWSNTGIGFYGAAEVAKPAITGSRGGNAALASLLTAGATLGLWTDSTTA